MAPKQMYYLSAPSSGELPGLTDRLRAGQPLDMNHWAWGDFTVLIESCCVYRANLTISHAYWASRRTKNPLISLFILTSSPPKPLSTNSKSSEQSSDHDIAIGSYSVGCRVFRYTFSGHCCHDTSNLVQAPPESSLSHS